MLENNRPVSILTVVSNVLEKCVYCQLNKFLTDNNILYEFQSGFRGKFSTDTCLIQLLDHIRDKNSEGLFTGMVLLDLLKAFDTVDHNILCGKLTNIGIQAHWFQSYLSGRSQMVGLDGILSDSSPVTCGVPQGSILGPLLFLCYVNDMATSIDADCKLILYADDSAILFSHRDPETISIKLGTALESCSDWLVDNKLSLHLGKTECIMFGPMRKLKDVFRQVSWLRMHVKSPSLGGRLPLFDLISLLNIHLPPRSGNLPLIEPNFLPIIFSLKRVNCIEFCKVNALLSQQSIHKVQ